MIASFRNKALQRLYEGGNGRGLPSTFVPKLRRALYALDNAVVPEDVMQPGFGLHQLAGDMDKFWSIVISRNWRVIFRIEKGDVFDVDFIDYH